MLRREDGTLILIGEHLAVVERHAEVSRVRNLLDHARQTAAQQNVHVSTDDLIEAVARGFDAVTPTQS